MVVIGWKQLKRKNRNSGRALEKRKRKLVGDQPQRCETGRKLRHQLWVSSTERSHTGCEDVTMRSHVRKLHQKMRKMITRSAFASLVLHRFISLCLSKAVNFLFCLSSATTKKGSSKFIFEFQQTNRPCLSVRYVFFFSLWWRLLRGSDWNLKRSATLIDYLERKWHTSLCGTVMLQASTWYGSITDPRTLLCRLPMSEANIGGMAVEDEVLYQKSLFLVGHVTHRNWGDLLTGKQMYSTNSFHADKISPIDIYRRYIKIYWE